MAEKKYKWLYCVQCGSSQSFERKEGKWQCPNCHAMREEDEAEQSLAHDQKDGE